MTRCVDCGVELLTRCADCNDKVLWKIKSLDKAEAEDNERPESVENENDDDGGSSVAWSGPPADEDEEQEDIEEDEEENTQPSSSSVRITSVIDDDASDDKADEFAGEKEAEHDEEKNGMTPLHFAEDCPTVEALLQYHADINAKDNIAQTPLHVAAAHNKKEIVKFLLNWQGPEKLELEAKTMYGETPLHMAAKNGCTEVLRLLLEHNADIEARANNGMTPLHFAVLHSLQAEDCSNVEALLQYHADINAKDNDDITTFSYLSQDPSIQKPHSLLQVHLDEQTKRKAKEACEKLKSKMLELEVELSKVVGLHKLKVQLQSWAKGMLLDEQRRGLGLKVAARRLPHMAFLGNPGTGKTMVARILGKLLHMIGVLPTDKVTEVQRTDLVGEFIGQTGPKTREKINEAEGGILFVDEAYRLITMRKADDGDFGLEALEEIMSKMDSGKVVVIFAGYAEPMKRVIGSNEGFRRRVTRYFDFDDFSPRELAEIVQLKMNEQVENSLLCGFKLHETCSVEAIADLMIKNTTENQRKELNGGLVDAMLVNARENLDRRLDFNCDDKENLVTITFEDLEAGLRLVSS